MDYTLSHEQVVNHLRSPDAYPSRPRRVETKETHMSWVFLTDMLAYKLKKPLRVDSIDWSTVGSRRRDCQREVKLNRRLAADVYHGVVPLTIDATGRMALSGDGEPVDWLVKMRRLPEAFMLDWQIEHECVDAGRLCEAIAVLCRFYGRSAIADITGRKYCNDLGIDLVKSCRELVVPRYGQSVEQVHSVRDSLLRYIERNTSLLEERVGAGRVLDAHGDLRPEHICLEPDPVIIDCLQFDRRLRRLDTASELCFLTLELQRLGVSHLNDTIWPVYYDLCEDRPPYHLLLFYQAYHACLRAMIAVWHLTDDIADPQKWTRRARGYLGAAERFARTF